MQKNEVTFLRTRVYGAAVLGAGGGNQPFFSQSLVHVRSGPHEAITVH